MNCCLQNYTTHQFAHFIYIIYMKTNSNIQESSKSNKYIKIYQENMIGFLEEHDSI